MEAAKRAAPGIYWHTMETEKNQIESFEAELDCIPDGVTVKASVSAALDALKAMHYIRRLKQVTGCQKVILHWHHQPTWPHTEEDWAYFNSLRQRLARRIKNDPVPDQVLIEKREF